MVFYCTPRHILNSLHIVFLLHYANLCGFFSCTGYTSIRLPGKGSWFIQTLCKVLQEEALVNDLMSMLTMVTDKVAGETAYTINRIKCAPETTNNLRMKLYFLPKITWSAFEKEYAKSCEKTLTI